MSLKNLLSPRGKRADAAASAATTVEDDAEKTPWVRCAALIRCLARCDEWEARDAMVELGILQHDTEGGGREAPTLEAAAFCARVEAERARSATAAHARLQAAMLAGRGAAFAGARLLAGGAWVPDVPAGTLRAYSLAPAELLLRTHLVDYEGARWFVHRVDAVGGRVYLAAAPLSAAADFSVALPSPTSPRSSSAAAAALQHSASTTTILHPFRPAASSAPVAAAQ